MKMYNRPELILLVGPPGCGKSTFAKNLNSDDTKVYLSSDLVRKELYGDESCQDSPEIVFETMKERAHTALSNGASVIWDATNMTRKSRASALSCATTETKKIAVVIFATIDKCIKRDGERERTVGKDIIMRMLKNFQFPYYDEGIDEIRIERNAEDSVWEIAASGCNIQQDNPHHTKTVEQHCKSAWEYAYQHDFDYSVQLATTLHDCGKPETKSFHNSKGEPTEIAHYYGHQGVSAWKAMSATFDPLVLWLVNTHMDPYLNTKYYRNLSPWMKQLVDELHEADVAAH